MTEPWQRFVSRWAAAGVIDADTAARIQAFEAQQAGSTRLKWPILVALAFGAVMIGAGILLFVSAYWNSMTPGVRIALVSALVVLAHASARLAADRFAAMASALHAVGTMALGGVIFLTGQALDLEKLWPTGFLVWAIGAAVTWAFLRDAPQVALVAVLVPTWITTEWIRVTQSYAFVNAQRVFACGAFLLALAYFTAPERERPSIDRRILMWIGGLLLIPYGILMAESTGSHRVLNTSGFPAFPANLMAVGWTVALALPLILAAILHRQSAWRIAVATGWVGILIWIGATTAGGWPLYAWWAIGAIGLVAWGVQAVRVERINMGSAALALTVLSFYFSHVMDKLGRSLSLVMLGVLFLAGGWALERARRRLVRHARGVA